MQEYVVVIQRLDNPLHVTILGPYASKYAAKKQKQFAEDIWGLVHYSIKVRPANEKASNQ